MRLQVLWLSMLMAVLPMSWVTAQEPKQEPLERPVAADQGAPEEPEASDSEAPIEEDAEKLHVREEILVTADQPTDPFVQELVRRVLELGVPADAAEQLRGVAGVSVGRMGGHGLEPRIRGLGENSINVLIDGAYVHGGCPNRMDPPTSYAAVGSFERVVVMKGVQTVRHGGGGSAGTLLFERSTPRFRSGERWRLDLGTGYGSYHQSPDLRVDAALGSPSFYLRAIANRRALESYEDGDGNEVRSAFDRRDMNFILGWTPGYGSLLELGYEINRTDDALFAGAGMDSPEDRNRTMRLKFRQGQPWGRWTGVLVDLYSSEVDHLMDNYSLRPLTAPMAMRAPSESDTFGGRVSGDLRLAGEATLTVGLDYQDNRRQALRLAGPDPGSVATLQSVLWPDARLSQAGLFLEGSTGLGQSHRLRVGLRLDRFEAEARRSNLKPAGMNRSPEQLYRLYYDTDSSQWYSSDVSALIRWERIFGGSDLRLFSGLSRSVRTADATERYLASNNMSPARRWIGNPELEPARHHQLDLGLAARKTERQWSISGFYDRVDDFILRDRAHGQPGIEQSDSATIYRNVEAELLGLEASLAQRLADGWSFHGTAGWVLAENLTDQRSMAQIPPLQGRLLLSWSDGPWGAWMDLRYALRQTRVDDDPATGSGLDAGETPGYLVPDLAANVELARGMQLQFGVENLLDKTYADHLNRSSSFDPEQVRVNEPGRTFWIKLGWRGGGGR